MIDDFSSWGSGVDSTVGIFAFRFEYISLSDYSACR